MFSQNDGWSLSWNCAVPSGSTTAYVPRVSAPRTAMYPPPTHAVELARHAPQELERRAVERSGDRAHPPVVGVLRGHGLREEDRVRARARAPRAGSGPRGGPGCPRRRRSRRPAGSRRPASGGERPRRRSRSRSTPGGSSPKVRPAGPRAASRRRRRRRRPARGARAATPGARGRGGRRAAGPTPRRPAVGRRGAQRGELGVEPRVAARRRPISAEHRVHRLGRAVQRAQDVERLDVARALPDRHQRRLAVGAGEPRLLDVAEAALALERLARVLRCALARPVLEDGRGEPREQRLARRRGARPRWRGPAAARRPWPPRTRARGRRAPPPSPAARPAGARRPPGARPVDRLGGAQAHHGRRAEHAVVPRAADHRHDRPDAAALLADEDGVGAARAPPRRSDSSGCRASTSAGRSRRPLSSPSRCRRGTSRSERPPAGVREHEERVRLRRGDEPLRPVDAPRAVAVGRRGRWSSSRHVRAARALGQRHADQRAALAGRAAARVVDAGGHERLPGGRRLGEPQRRDARVGHRERAGDAGLGLGDHQELRRARDVRSGPVVGPRRPGDARAPPTGPSAGARRDGRRARRRAARPGRSGRARADGRWRRTRRGSSRGRRARAEGAAVRPRTPSRPRGARPRAARRRRRAGSRRAGGRSERTRRRCGHAGHPTTARAPRKQDHPFGAALPPWGDAGPRRGVASSP